MSDYKSSMVFYESAYLAIKCLPTIELQLEAYEGLMKYGFYGEEPESDNPFVKMFFIQAIPSMKCAKQRYEKAVENGSKGGRPTSVTDENVMKLKEEGKTNKEIAAILGCSEKNVEYRVKHYRESNPKNPKNPKNLSVYDTEYDTEYVNVSDNVSSEEKRNLEDLESFEGNDIIKRIKNHESYVDIQKRYNLKHGLITKDFPKQWKQICSNRAYLAEQKIEAEKRKNEPAIDYSRIGKVHEEVNDISQILNEM